MEPNRRSKIITIIGVSLLAMGICIFGATLLTNLYGNQLIGPSSSSSTSTSSETTESNVQSKWLNQITLDIPTNVSGGTKTVNLTDVVPFYESAYEGTNVSYYRDSKDPYLYKITVYSELGNSALFYANQLTQNNVYQYSCTDYYNDTLETGYVIECESYRVMITPFYNNKTDSLYIRYIPDGDYWPTSNIKTIFSNDACGLIPGMNLEETPADISFADSTLSFKYVASESQLLLYKQTLKHFGYEENSGLYTSKHNNEVMIDLSVENQVSIIAPAR